MPIWLLNSPKSCTKTPPTKLLGVGIRPDPPNGSKMMPPTTTNDAPDPPCWIDFGVDFEYLCNDLFTAIFLQFSIDFGADLQVKRGGGYAALLRSAAPGLVPAHGVQSPSP